MNPGGRPSFFGASRKELFCALVAWVVIGLPAAGQPQPLTVERLASLPNLSGTAPTKPVWSPDSTWLAFLWNDQGSPFRDVWVVSATEGAPKRITDMARDFPENPDPDSDARLAQEAVARSCTGVSETVWAPDGRALLLSYQGELFRVNPDGTGLSLLTRPPESKYALAFSPDSKFLTFLQEGDLWLWNQMTNERVQATRFAAPAIGTVPGAWFSRLDAEVTSYQWSPDSRSIALLLDDRRKVRTALIPNYLGDETQVKMLRRDFPGDNDHTQALGVYSLERGRIRLVELADLSDRLISSYSWSPTGSQLLVDMHSQDAVHRWIYVAKPEDGSVVEVWHDSRATRVSWFWTSRWQTDGEGILFVSDIDGRHRLYSLRPGEKPEKQLTRGDWSVIGESGTASLAVSSATKQVYFVSTQKNRYERPVYRMPETGGPITQVTSLPGTHFPFLSPDGLKIALLHSNDLIPTELYIVDSQGGAAERRITRSPPEEFYTYPWIQPRYVSLKSHVDGVTLHGRLLEPLNLDRSKKYPAIIGPVYPNTVRNRWGDRQEWRGLYSTLQQYLALEGQYIVLQVDVRGSVGYGRDFREKLLMDYGGIDIEDLHSGVQYLISLPYVDPERIGIWGSSYGGLMTLMSLFKKPGVYKAGVAGAPATNVWHATPHEVRVCRRPDVHPEVYRRSSAISYGEDLKDHLLLIHGMQDSIVLFKDTVTLAEKLMLLGKAFDFVVAPSAVHRWTEKDYVAMHLLTKLVGHFDRYLGRGPR